MKFLIVLAIFATSCYAGRFDNLVLRFFGTSHSDYQNLTLTGNLNHINETYFNMSKLSVLIVHGFLEGYNSDMIKEMYSAFATRPEYNIIMADWGSRSSDFYPSIILYLNDMADQFVFLLNKTKAAGYDLTKIYPVGFSLGAHLAGQIGAVLKSQGSKLPRITGLDPAGVLYNWAAILEKYFGDEANITPIKILSDDDATFVDVIHSNAFLFLGVDVTVGDIDFWPNGGAAQPHCSSYCSFFNLLLNMDDCLLCTHDAAFFYYVESVRSPTPIFASRGCPDNVLMKSALTCTEPDIAYMGFHATNNTKIGSYWLETNSEAPYSK